MDNNNLDGISFEAALSELESLVGKMENGRLSLDELVKGFERGQKLAGFCRSKLDALERKITLLVKDDGGSGQWQDFGNSENSAAPDNGRQSLQDQDIPF